MKMRSHCPTNFALEHFGDKWSLLIVRDLMFKGKRHYNEFLEAGEKVSTSVLRDRLRSLEQAGILTKGSDTVKKSRIRYNLTQKGIDLLPMMIDMISWSGKYDGSTEAGSEFLNRAANDREALLAELQKELRKQHL